MLGGSVAAGSKAVEEGRAPLTTLLGAPAPVFPLSEVMARLGQQTRPIDALPYAISHNISAGEPSLTRAYDLQLHEPPGVAAALCAAAAAALHTAPAAAALASLDTQLSATLDRLEQHASRRAWLRSLLHADGDEGAALQPHETGDALVAAQADAAGRAPSLADLVAPRAPMGAVAGLDAAGGEPGGPAATLLQGPWASWAVHGYASSQQQAGWG